MIMKKYVPINIIKVKEKLESKLFYDELIYGKIN